MLKCAARRRSVALFSCLMLGLTALVACSGGPPAEVAQATPVVVASDTPAPTVTTAPTNTPLPPTETPTPTPTDTPSPTPTETPTATPTDTPTPLPTSTPTNTPTPSLTPTATPVPATPTPWPTATPEATATVEYITVFYRSNPNDILGVFPLRPFDAQALYNNMTRLRSALYTMRDAINGAAAGDAEACATYARAYESILYSGVFYDDVPPDWEEIDFIYFLSFIYSLDRTRPAYLSCKDAGQVDQFNYGLALQTIDETLQILNPAVDAAAAKVG